jgi:hypothetical protein
MVRQPAGHCDSSQHCSDRRTPDEFRCAATAGAPAKETGARVVSTEPRHSEMRWRCTGVAEEDGTEVRAREFQPLASPPPSRSDRTTSMEERHRTPRERCALEFLKPRPQLFEFRGASGDAVQECLGIDALGQPALRVQMPRAPRVEKPTAIATGIGGRKGSGGTGRVSWRRRSTPWSRPAPLTATPSRRARGWSPPPTPGRAVPPMPAGPRIP